MSALLPAYFDRLEDRVSDVIITAFIDLEMAFQSVSYEDHQSTIESTLSTENDLTDSDISALIYSEYLEHSILVLKEQGVTLVLDSDIAPLDLGRIVRGVCQIGQQGLMTHALESDMEDESPLVEFLSILSGITDYGVPRLLTLIADYTGPRAPEASEDDRPVSPPAVLARFKAELSPGDLGPVSLLVRDLGYVGYDLDRAVTAIGYELIDLEDADLISEVRKLVLGSSVAAKELKSMAVLVLEQLLPVERFLKLNGHIGAFNEQA